MNITFIKCANDGCLHKKKMQSIFLGNDCKTEGYDIDDTIWTIWAISYESYSSNNTDFNRKKSLIDNVLEQIRFYQMNGSQVRDTFS